MIWFKEKSDSKSCSKVMLAVISMVACCDLLGNEASLPNIKATNNDALKILYKLSELNMVAVRKYIEEENLAAVDRNIKLEDEMCSWIALDVNSYEAKSKSEISVASFVRCNQYSCLYELHLDGKNSSLNPNFDILSFNNIVREYPINMRYHWLHNANVYSYMNVLKNIPRVYFDKMDDYVGQSTVSNELKLKVTSLEYVFNLNEFRDCNDR